MTAFSKSKTPLRSRRVLEELKKCGVTHIVWLPDTGARPMYEAMKSAKEFTLIPVCREGEAIAIATGLMLGGKNPVVLHQNSGFFESGDSVRGFALDLRLPLLIIVGYAGWQRNAPITDSRAIFTEPFLNAWGIKHYLVEGDKDVDKMSLAYKEAHETNRPVAILVGREYE